MVTVVELPVTGPESEVQEYVAVILGFRAPAEIEADSGSPGKITAAEIEQLAVTGGGGTREP